MYPNYGYQTFNSYQPIVDKRRKHNCMIKNLCQWVCIVRRRKITEISLCCFQNEGNIETHNEHCAKHKAVKFKMSTEGTYHGFENYLKCFPDKVIYPNHRMMKLRYTDIAKSSKSWKSEKIKS